MLQPGTLINQRYQIVRQVGQGGFGFVYEARDIRLAKTVALKQTRFTDAQRKQAFEREAQLLAQLKHAGLPPVTDHFSDADGQFLVMEFIPGDDLAPLLKQQHEVRAALVQVMAIKSDDCSASATVQTLRQAASPSLAGTPPALAPAQVIHPLVGAPTIPVRPPPATRKAPPFLLRPGMLLAVVLVGAFFLGGCGLFANQGGAPAVPPPTSVPVATTVAVAVPPTVAPTAVPPTAVPPTTAPAALPAWVPTMVKVPAGPFFMGSTDQQIAAVISQGMNADWVKGETPQHTQTLPDYWIGRTEVTNAQFRPFVEGDGYTNPAYWTEAGWTWRQENKITQPFFWDDPQWNGPDYPVVGVSWFEAVAYCRWLSKQTGIEFRLPSETEWEKAARGPKGLLYPWGDTWDAKRVNSSESGLKRTTLVGSYLTGASPYGALDMAGNVWEWCATPWGKTYPYQLEDEWQAIYLESEAARVFRGGAFYNESAYVRGAYRNYYGRRHVRLSTRGLRVASHALMP